MTFFNIFSKKPVKEKKNQKIIVDYRDKNSLVPSELIKAGNEIEFKQLPVADYLVNGIAIERKTISDLKSSIINKRIFSQLLELKQYPKHFLLIEGNQEELYNNEILHENAIRGFLLSLATEYHTPFLFSSNEKESAKIMIVLSNKKEKLASINPKKISHSKEEQARFILEGFPGIGPAKAKKLLEKFHSLKNIFNAQESDLQEILGKRTVDFIELLN